MPLIVMVALICTISALITGTGITGKGIQEIADNNFNEIMAYDYAPSGTLDVIDTWGIYWILDIGSNGYVNNMEWDYEMHGADNHYNHYMYIPSNGTYLATDRYTGITYNVIIDWSKANNYAVSLYAGASYDSLGTRNTNISALYRPSNLSDSRIYKNSELLIESNTTGTYNGYNFAGHSHSVTPTNAPWFTNNGTTAAKCTTAGSNDYRCRNCHNDFSIAIPALGHSYTSKITTRPTCTSNGVKTYTCSRSGCGNSYTEAIAALGHNISDTIYYNGEHYNECLNNCGLKQTVSEHNSSITGTVGGLNYSACSICGWTNSNGTFTSSENVRNTDNLITGTMNSSVTFTFTTISTATLNFDYRVSSEKGWDILSIYLDDTVLTKEDEDYDGISGEVGWTNYNNTNISAGSHTLNVKYEKDDSGDAGEDLAQIRNISVTPNTAAYKVQHWQQKVTGAAGTHDSTNYTLVSGDTQNLSGNIGASITPGVKTYTGFTSPSTETTTIKADGTTVVNYYYTRKSYSVTLNKGTGIASVSGASTSVLYGESVTVDATVSAGYTWLNWDGTNKTTTKQYTFTMPASNVTMTASAKANTNTAYKVQHWQQKLEGVAGTHNSTNYTLVSGDTQNLTGTTGASIKPGVKTYTGFTSPSVQTTTIKGDGTTVVNYYYTRNSYSVTLNEGTGIKSVIQTYSDIRGEHLYGASVTVGATLKDNTVQYTYGWKNWTGTGVEGSNNQTYTFTMPAGNVTLTANGTETVNKYLQTIKVRYQNADGRYGEYTNKVNQEYEYGETVSYSEGATDTYKAGSITSYTVTGAKTTELTIDRQTYTVTLNKGKGIASIDVGAGAVSAESTQGTYRVGETVKINAEVEEGYTWKNWTGASEIATNSYTFEIGTRDVTYTANTTLNTYTITYVLNGGNVTGNPENYTVETGTITLKKPTKTGYTFIGWTGSNGNTAEETVTIERGTIGNKNYTANWIPKTDTEYTVQHWQQNLNGEGNIQDENNYTLVDTDNLEGTTDSQVTPKVKSYPGFTAPTEQSLTITADGKAVLNYYYTRNTNIAYKVMHWKQNLNGNAEIKDETNYTLVSGDTQNLTGTTGARVEVETKTYEGYVSPNKESIEITGDGQAVLNYYYARRTDLSYTVKYLEKGTTNEIKEAKTVSGQTFENTIETSTEKIEIEGYNYDSMNKETLKITTGENEIIIYYTRKTGLSYKVNHLEKETNEVIAEQEEKDGKTFGDKITATEEIKEIYGYQYNSSDKEELTITTGENIITIYYTKKDTKVIVHHYLQGTEEKVSEDVEIPGKVFDKYETQVANINDRYELVSRTENTEGEMTEEEIEVIYYYIIRTSDTRQSQEIETEKGKGYVIEGETIKYTITVENRGNLGKEVTVKGNIPEGTTYVEGSIKIDNETTENTVENLTNGITINVPMAEKNVGAPFGGIQEGSDTTVPVRPSVVTISFEVVVNEGATGDIVNKGIVDEEETEETKMPILTYEKTGKIARKEETSKLAENEVTVGDMITYTIKIMNTGSKKVENIKVTDKAPKGTKIENAGEGEIKGKGISWDIEEIEAGGKAEVEFTVEVEYANDDYTIESIGKVDENETNEVNYEFKKSTIGVSSEITNTTTIDKITSKETPIYYEVEVNAEITYFAGKAIITTIDKLPYPIKEEESEIAGGKYDEETQTITWVDEIDNIDTFETGEPKQIKITKAITVMYDYGTLDGTAINLKTKVEYNIKLLELNKETGETGEIEEGEYEEVKTEVKEEESENSEPEVEIKIEIPTEVIVRHYIYDKGETQSKLVADEIIEGIVGDEYETRKSEEVPSNYKCINEEPELYKGNMSDETIEVKYYYELETPKIEDNIDMKVEVDNISSNLEDGKVVITKEDEEIKYGINYEVKIEDYIGKADIEIVVELPEKIEIDKSNINGGKYDEETQTITWEISKDIDTYKNGNYDEIIKREITVVYKNIEVGKALVAKVRGKVTTYYPEEHPTEGETGEYIKQEATESTTTTEAVEQEYKVDFKVGIDWEDNENQKGKRPENVIVEIMVMPIRKSITKELNEGNNWTYEEKGLPKYNKAGEEISYIVIQSEKEENDLEYYEGAEITETETETENGAKKVVTVTNAYKLIDADFNTEMTVEGTKEITQKDQVIENKINFKSEISNYIGEGKVTIKETIPYKIDEEKSKLAKGIYNEETKTITWEEELPHINTFKNGEASNADVGAPFGKIQEGSDTTVPKTYKIDITKEISLVYKDIDLNEEKMEAEIKGKVELYETEEKEEETKTIATNINVQGKVTVKYIDRETGKEIAEGEEIVDKIGREYSTIHEEEIGRYEYIESTNNETGKIREKEQVVIYYYEIPKGEIEVKYQDTEGNEIELKETIKGYVGDTYKIETKEIENWRHVETKGETEGTIKKEKAEVIYVYEKIPAKVIVKYITIEGEEEKELLASETIEGYAGDHYEVSRKVVKGYKAKEPEPTNVRGKMPEGEIEIVYYYEKLQSGMVKVKYVDIDTKEEIENIDTKEKYGYEINGYVGDEYETEKVEIPYYVFEKATENVKGELTETGDTVIYYYRKLIFNISVDETIEKIEVNGESKKISDTKLAKVELKTAEVENTNLIISYNIKVTNEGELAGKAKIQEKIQKGYEIIELENYWKETKEGILETEIEIEPGESRDLKVTLKWINNENNLGSITNTAEIVETENIANYEDINEEDDKDTATVVVSIKTGEVVSAIIIGMLIISFGISGYMVNISIRRMRKGQNIGDIRFLRK